MNLNVSRMVNANIYVNGADLLGRAEEIDLPQPKGKMVEHKGLGMWGSPEFVAGLDKMEMRIKWASFYPEVLGFSFDMIDFQSLMVRGDVQQFTSQGLSAELPAVALVTAAFKNSPSFKIKKHENVDFETDLAVFYYKLTFAGADEVEIDVMANIYKIKGVDQLAQFRANIGG